jgi:hypothetical protein
MNKEDVRKELRNQEKKCHYCGITEDEFRNRWGVFRHGRRGLTLEVDKMDNTKPYSLYNCVLACYACNNAKSDVFTYEEFKKVGHVINEIWQHRKGQGFETKP